MRGWKDLEVVETIYEEEHEDASSASSFLSPTLSSPPTPLHSTVQSWSVSTGHKTDVKIHVQGTCFHLHRDTMASRSAYLKRQLAEFSELTLSPPLTITAETFTLVAEFCYSTHVVITPFNLAPLRIAAELLEMTEHNSDGDENLRQITEMYFFRVVADNQEYATIVFHSSLALLPEAETTAFLVSRCIETLSFVRDGDDVFSGIDDVIAVRAEDFLILAESMHRRFKNHDVLYKIVDLYLTEYSGKISDEQKTQICNSIDCNKLSTQILIPAVQNPKMPLRLIVRAMLADHLNTRRSILLSTTTDPHPHIKDAITLGGILQREAAFRQAAQIKAAMDSTSSRIQTLEKELNSMKKILQHQSSDKETNVLENLESGRSVSFHYGSEKKIKRGERGSVSSLSCRFIAGEERVSVFKSSSLEGSCNGSPRLSKSIAQKLINGLKSAFRMSNSASRYCPERNISSKVDVDGLDDIIAIEENFDSHRGTTL